MSSLISSKTISESINDLLIILFLRFLSNPQKLSSTISRKTKVKKISKKPNPITNKNLVNCSLNTFIASVINPIICMIKSVW